MPPPSTSNPTGRVLTVLGSRAVRVAGIVAIVGGVLVYLGSLVLLHRSTYSPLWDGWVGNLVLIAPTTACFVRALLGGPRRAAAFWLGVGLTSFTAGNVIYIAWTQFQAHVPALSPSAIGYLGVYPAFAVAFICLIRRDGETLSKAVLLDGALGAAGAATALAALLNPVLAGLTGNLGQVLVAAASPVGDLLLIAMICGLLAFRGLRGGSLWLWLAGGLTIFCAADVVYALRVVANDYVPGTVLDGLWVVALAIIALAVWRPERPRAVDSGRSTAILAVPLAGTLTAIIVLVFASFHRLSVVVVALAGVTLLLAIVRTIVSFRQVQRLSDAHRQAITDELTGLGNRRQLFEAGARRLQGAGSAERIALLMIDLDDFKEVNDALGHHGGDQLLREAARRLAARVSPGDLLVRLGGDEFALVVTLGAGDDGRAIADRILDRLSRPLVIDGLRIVTQASVGIAQSTDAGDTIAELLRRADLAMYAAKKARSRIALYDPQLDEENRTRVTMTLELEAALAGQEFVLHYQPKIDVVSGTAIGAEALVRWQHPAGGLLYPDAFLPAVERSGLMPALTQVVLEAAVRQIAMWRADGLFISVAVNLSASDLLDAQLSDRISRLLAEHEVPTGALEIEITETVLMSEPGRALRVLAELRDLGLRIAVDDYGTGYSSLAYLRDLPVHELKIDRSFVADMAADPRSVAIVGSTIDLAHSLDLTVVAEGVEDLDTLAALASLHCDFAQGYHFSRPLDAEAFAAWAGARAAALLC